MSLFGADNGEYELWPRAGDYTVLESRPTAFEAGWIDPGPELRSDAVGAVFYLRKKFPAPDPSAFRRVYVSADSQYKLYVNGVPAARGPGQRLGSNAEWGNQNSLAAGAGICHGRGFAARNNRRG